LGFVDRAELLDPDGEATPDPHGQDVAFHRQVRDRIATALKQRISEILVNALRA